MKYVFAFGMIMCTMGCGSPTAPSPQTYTVSLTPTCVTQPGCTFTTEGQAFPVSLSRAGVITATLESVTPPPTVFYVRLVIGTPISQPGYGIHGCDVGDARY